MDTAQHTSLHCLASVARHHGVDLSPERLLHDYAVGEQAGRHPAAAADGKGCRAARPANASFPGNRFTRLGDAYPVLAELENGNWVVMAGPTMSATDQEMVRVLDPLAERPEVLLVDRRAVHAAMARLGRAVEAPVRLSDTDQPFGFRWFIPELVRQRNLFRDVAIAAFVLYAPRAGNADLLPARHRQGAGARELCDADGADDRHRDRACRSTPLFTFLRRYLLLYATNKIDIRVATRTFGHLLNLPISLFEQASAGVLVKHMQQTSRIREFLTGRLFLTLLDGLSLLVFVPILFFYSVKLTLVVLGFAALVGLVVLRSSARSGGACGPLQGRGRAPGAARRNRSRHAHGQVAGAGAAAAPRLGR